MFENGRCNANYRIKLGFWGHTKGGLAGPSTRTQNICIPERHQGSPPGHRIYSLCIPEMQQGPPPGHRIYALCIPEMQQGPPPGQRIYALCIPEMQQGPPPTILVKSRAGYIVDCRLSYIQYVPYGNFVSTPGLSIFCVFGCHRRPNALSHCRCYDAKKLSLAQLCSKFVPKVDHCSGKICLCFVSKGLKKIVVYNNSKTCNVQ